MIATMLISCETPRLVNKAAIDASITPMPYGKIKAIFDSKRGRP